MAAGYLELLQELKTRIRAAQLRAAFAVSRELILLYWSIGREILTRQDAQGWGAKIVERLAHDLQTEFPGVEGFSARSLKYMRAFAAAWSDEPIVRQLAAQLPVCLKREGKGSRGNFQSEQSRGSVATILNLLQTRAYDMATAARGRHATTRSTYRHGHKPRDRGSSGCAKVALHYRFERKIGKWKNLSSLNSLKTRPRSRSFSMRCGS